jgi:hypothetical protein
MFPSRNMLATNAGDGVVRTLALFLGPGARRCGAVGGSAALARLRGRMTSRRTKGPQPVF